MVATDCGREAMQRRERFQENVPRELGRGILTARSCCHSPVASDKLAAPSCGSPPIEWHSAAVLEYPLPTRRNLPVVTSPFWTRSSLRQDTALPRCRWETSAPNPSGVFTVCTQVAIPSETLGYACPASGSPQLRRRLMESPSSPRGPGCPEGRPVPPFVVTPVVGSRYLLPHTGNDMNWFCF